MKRICELTTTEFGFAETHATLEPIERRYRRDGDVFPEFMDVNVKQLLDSAKRRGGYVLFIEQTPTTYRTERVYACPDCGFPLKKHGAHYTCVRAENCQRYGIEDRNHASVRVWMQAELDSLPRPVQ